MHNDDINNQWSFSYSTRLYSGPWNYGGWFVNSAYLQKDSGQELKTLEEIDARVAGMSSYPDIESLLKNILK